MSIIHRFIEDFNFDFLGEDMEIAGDVARQISKVLKLHKNEEIELTDGKGKNILAKIEKVESDKVKLKIEKTWVTENKKEDIFLFCAILKKENFEWVVQKATECGVSKIIPIITDRTIKTGLNLERLEKIAKEASEQSGRSFISQVLKPVSFSSLIENFNSAEKKELNILFDKSGKSYEPFLKNDFPKNLFIGPEGGWTEEEIKKARHAGLEIVSLGKNTLRGETAAIVASYLFSN